MSKTTGPAARPAHGPGRGPTSRYTMEKPRLKDPRGTLRRLFGYMRGMRIQLVLVALLVSAAVILNVLAPWLMARVVDYYILGGRTGQMSGILTLLALSYLGSSLFTWLQARLMIRVSQQAVLKLRQDLFARIQKMPLSFFDSRPHGDLMSRMTNDIDNISTSLSQNVTQFFSNFLTLAGVAVMMLLLSVPLALITMILLPLAARVMGVIGKRTRKRFSRQQASLGQVNSMIEEYIGGHQVVKAYGRQEELSVRFDGINGTLKKESVSAQVFAGTIWPVMNLFNNLSYALVILAGAVLVVNRTVSLGTLTAFMNYSKQFSHPLNQIAQQYNSIQLALAGAERVFEIMDSPDEYTGEPDLPDPQVTGGRVVFEDVDFSYVPGTPVLQNVSMDAGRGQVIALVGPTGAGKTTVINLLTRFYEVDSGVIRLDGADIRNLSRDGLRRKLGIVLQDPYLFSGTVRDNVRYGRLEATDQEVEEACRMAGAHSFIHRLPHGYETVLTGEGANLSQGQKQLLSIARALLADPDILILDEATSSVDTRTEQLIQQALRTLMKGKTSFVIAHRLSTIRSADRILVIRNGRISEQGTHEELLDARGDYCRMFNSQFRLRAKNGVAMCAEGE